MVTADLLEAHEAFARRDWAAARDALLRAQEAGPLSAEDVYTLGECVWWLGEFRRAESLYEQAYDLFLKEGHPRRAAMSAFAIAGLAFMRGQAAYGSGWQSRAIRILENEPPCAEQGYILFAEVSGALFGGDAPAAIELARRLQETGRQFSDPNLVALGTLSEGQALLRQGAIPQGMRLLDEAMVAAVSDALAPEWAGYIYCQLMGACHELGDLLRAREWTEATRRWCESLSASGPFLGVCRMHRAQVFQAQGAWDRAEAEAALACEQLADFDVGSTAEGYYQIGEVRRLRGDLPGAEQAYRQAHALGREPQPGLSLLLLAHGHPDQALASIQAALSTAAEPLHRVWLCVACADIALKAGDTATARAAAEELRDAAAKLGSPVLKASAGYAEGALLLSDGKPGEALAALRDACLAWQRLTVPYEVARTRVLLARAYEALGDRAAAALEADAARQVFSSLGAMLDLQALEAGREDTRRLPGGLTEREADVLTLVAEGQSNRAIAEALVISEKTVARHLSNIYAKLGVTSRTEAARFAFEHDLARRVGNSS